MGGEEIRLDRVERIGFKEIGGRGFERMSRGSCGNGLI